MFWTGGWDSTFLLLQFLFTTSEPIQPYYLVDENRKSLRWELLAMKKIRKKITHLNPVAVQRLLPLKLFTVSSIPINSEIDESYTNIRKNIELGTQYKWLANFCEYQNLFNVVMGIEKGNEKALIGAAERIIAPLLTGSDSAEIVGKKFSQTDEYNIFKYYRFPLIHTTKQEMRRIVEDNKWQDIMDTTWFCHAPAPNGKPCGTCAPCRLLRKEGFGHRIPTLRRYLGVVKR